MIRYFLTPYEHFDNNGIPARRCLLAQAHADIRAVGGYWEESEIAGDQALVRVRATPPVLTMIQNNLAVTAVSDPASVWTPTRFKPAAQDGQVVFTAEEVQTKSLELLTRDVLSDQESAQLLGLAEQLMRRADVEGHITLTGYPWDYAVKMLGYLGSQGYNLTRISTGTFPVNGVLDNFNRADEGPPPSASWDWKMFGSAPGAGLGVITNRAGGTAASGPRTAYWNTVFGPDCEAFCTIGVVPTNNDIAVAVRFKDVGTGGADATGADGYVALWDTTAPQGYYYERSDNAALTQLGGSEASTMDVDDKFGLEAIGSTLQVYENSGGGWAAFGTSRTDSTYPAAGYIGAWHGGTVARLDDFGGGTIGGGDVEDVLGQMVGM